MQISKDETWWATHVHADDTARTVMMRHGDNPSEDDAAYEVALQLVALHEADRDEALAEVGSHKMALVRKYFLEEMEMRTVPGAHRKSLAPVVGAKGGETRDDLLPVASAEPGPDGVSDGPARASIGGDST